MCIFPPSGAFASELRKEVTASELVLKKGGFLVNLEDFEVLPLVNEEAQLVLCYQQVYQQVHVFGVADLQRSQ